MMRTSCFFLFQFILFQSFPQKLKEQELTQYTWHCLNSHWSDQQLLDKDTLVLIKSYDRVKEEGIANPTDYKDGAFSFWFDDSARVVDVIGIKKTIAFVLTVEDSILYQELKNEHSLTFASFQSQIPGLSDTISYVAIHYANEKLLFTKRTENWKQIREKQGVQRSIVDLAAVKGAAWQLDEKRRILTLERISGNQTIHYRIRRVSKNKLLLIRLP
jgi:hypothetical protein